MGLHYSVPHNNLKIDISVHIFREGNGTLERLSNLLKYPAGRWLIQNQNLP